MIVFDIHYTLFLLLGERAQSLPWHPAEAETSAKAVKSLFLYYITAFGPLSTGK
jgi:hypothetical protein